jgi:inosine/xanthosine triphosphate pyrophosphatase family protein
MPEGYDISAAELEPATKNALSHRARAIAELARVLGAA